MQLLEVFKSLILVSFGAVLGSSLRLFIYERLSIFSIKKNYRIFFINNLASFLVGLFYSFSINFGSFKDTYQLGLIFSIGFLGSLSTFSTYIYDLFELIYDFKIFQAIKIFILSLCVSLTCFCLGFSLGNL